MKKLKRYGDDKRSMTVADTIDGLGLTAEQMTALDRAMQPHRPMVAAQCVSMYRATGNELYLWQAYNLSLAGQFTPPPEVQLYLMNVANGLLDPATKTPQAIAKALNLSGSKSRAYHDYYASQDELRARTLKLPGFETQTAAAQSLATGERNVQRLERRARTHSTKTFPAKKPRA